MDTGDVQYQVITSFFHLWNTWVDSCISLNPISHGEDPISDILTMAKEGPHVAGDD